MRTEEYVLQGMVKEVDKHLRPSTGRYLAVAELRAAVFAPSTDGRIQHGIEALTRLVCDQDEWNMMFSLALWAVWLKNLSPKDKEFVEDCIAF